MLNAGVIGMGVGEKHARAYENHQNTILKTICDFDHEKLKELSAKFPNISIETNAQSILEDKNIDIISIASYDNNHCDQIIEAFNNGKHVMAEKPLCMNIDEMEKIKFAHKHNNGVRLSANHVLRTNSRFKRLKNDIQSGQLSEVYFLEGDYFWGRLHKLFEWRADMEYYSIILGAAIHMIDLIMWLLNSKPISVQAMGNNISNQGTKIQFNSFAIVLLKFENGIIAKLTGNGGCVHPHFHALKIFGTKQTVIHNLTNAYYLNSSKPNSDLIPITEPYPEKKVREKIIHSFVDSIIFPSTIPLVPQQDVYDVMSVCFAAEEAMNTGNTVKVNYLT